MTHRWVCFSTSVAIFLLGASFVFAQMNSSHDPALYTIHQGDDEPQGVLHSANTLQGLTTRYSERSITISRTLDPATSLEIGLRAMDDGTGLNTVTAARPQAESNRVTYHHSAITETFENRPEGIIYSLWCNPGPDVLELSLKSDNPIVLERDTLKVGDIRFRLLSVKNELGEPLESRLELERGIDQHTLRLLANTSDSSMPLTIRFAATRTAKIVPPAENNALGGFADSVAIRGDVMVVGAPNDDALGASSGAVWVYQRDTTGDQTWRLHAKLTPSDGQPYDHFGAAVALTDEYIVVGAPDTDREHESMGTAYVFAHPDDPEPLRELARLLPSDSRVYDQFGKVLVAENNVIVVGAPADNYRSDSSNGGGAFFFEGSSTAWEEVESLRSEGYDARVGISLAICADTVAIGGDETHNSEGRGLVRIYERSDSGTWSQKTTLQSPHTGTWDLFGELLALGEDDLIVRKNERYSAWTFFFTRDSTSDSGWKMVMQLHWTDGWGTSFSIYGSTLALGVPDYYEDGIDKGAVLLFTKSGSSEEPWVHTDTIVASQSIDYPDFGTVVALHEDQLAVAAPRDFRAGWLGRGRESVTIYERESPRSGLWHGQVRLESPSSPSSRRQLFGWALDADPRRVIIGAPYPFSSYLGIGRAYIYVRSIDEPHQWILEGSLTGDPVRWAGEFGYDVAINGNIAAVLAPREGVYLFSRRDGEWRKQTKFVMPIPPNGYRPFAYGISLSGTTLAFSRRGQVELFELVDSNDWIKIGQVIGGDRDFYFGSSIALDGDTLVVGVPADHPPTPWEPAGRPSTQIFHRHHGGDNAWGRVAVLTQPGEPVGTGFGTSVAISGTTVVVGVHNNNSHPGGVAFVYEMKNDADEPWRKVAEISPSNTWSWSWEKVAIDGDLIVLSNISYQYEEGNASVFRRSRDAPNSWAKVAVFKLINQGWWSEYWNFIALDGTTIAAGSPTDDEVGEYSGSVSVFDLELARPEGPAEISD